MPVAASDVLWKLSIKTGTAGNQSAQPDPNASLGKYISTTQWAGGVIHDLFDIVSDAESSAGDTEYRCIFIHNNHATITITDVEVWINAETGGGASLALSADTTAASAIGSASAQAKEVADENTAPTAQTFTSPTASPGISLGSIAPGQCKAFWIRRTVPAATTAMSNDGATLRLKFVTT